MGSKGRKIVSGLLGIAFVAALCPAVLAYADGNWADTPYSFNLAYNTSSDTERRAKLDYTSSYVKCTSNTGTAIVQSNGYQMGTTYSYGPQYPVGLGEQYLLNNVMEDRLQTNVTAYCYLRFTNSYYTSTIRTAGVWSPDSI